MSLAAAAVLLTGAAPGAHAQQTGAAPARLQAIPDAQVESNVLRALAAKPELAHQQITTNSVYGVVTLSGTVPDEATRTLAEDVVSRTAGVSKVIDELALGAPTTTATNNAQPQAASGDGDTNPLLQSDGTMAPPAGAQNDGAAPSSGTTAQDTYGGAPVQDGQSNGNVAAEQNGSLPPSAGAPYPAGGGYPQTQAGGGYSQPGQYPATQGGYPSNNYPQSGPPQNSYPQNNYPQNGGYPRGAYSAPAGPQGYGPGSYGQAAGQHVLVPAGTPLLIRMDQGIDSKHAVPGGIFTGTVVRDVYAGGLVAIPRGAQVQGTIVDARGSGAVSGRAELALALSDVNLAGSNYALQTEFWSRAGGDKTVRTVDSALGLGAVGAILGGVAGGGAGAAIGAGVGGVAGLGASAASGSTRILVAPESVISFRLSAPVEVSTVSQAEMMRLAGNGGYGAPMPRRFGPPPPPPYPYGYRYVPRVVYTPYGPRYLYRAYPY